MKFGSHCGGVKVKLKLFGRLSVISNNYINVMVIISWNPYPLFEVFRVFPSSFSMFRYHGMAQYLDGRVLRVLIYNTTHRLNIQIGLQVGLCCVLSDNKGTDRFVSVGSRPHQDRAVSQFLDL